MQLGSLWRLLLSFAAVIAFEVHGQSAKADELPLFCERFITVPPPDCSMGSLTASKATFGAGEAAQAKPSDFSPQDSGLNWTDRIAIVALLVSLATAAISHHQVQRARERSIRDDFWLRQVAYPYVLQPSLALVEWCAANFPEPGTLGVDIAALRTDFMRQWRLVRGRIAILREIDPVPREGAIVVPPPDDFISFTSMQLADQFDRSIEALQDAADAYFSELEDHAAHFPLYRETIQSIQEQAGLMIGALAKWQRAM